MEKINKETNNYYYKNRIAKTVMTNKNCWKCHHSQFQAVPRATVIKTTWYWHNNRF